MNEKLTPQRHGDFQNQSHTKPLASISLDLDNQWSYMKTYGESGWVEYPSYLETFVPYVLEILKKFNLEITFFIVGKDAAIDKNRDVLKSISANGHEIGNHSFKHEPWLNLYSKDAIQKEVFESEELIHRVTGEKPVGFRGPGFSWSRDLFQILSTNGYIYDSTTLPTYLGPLARAYYFRNPKLSQQQKDKRKQVLGGFSEGKRPIKPYCWNLPSGNQLLEIPITTIPVVKIPFHLSYLLFLSQISVNIMLLYLKIALVSCRLKAIEPNFIIHPTDLLDDILVPEMNFFPGMNISANRKFYIFTMIIKEIAKNFSLTNLRNHAKSILEDNSLTTLDL